MSTKKQQDYLEQLVLMHPNFQERFDWNTWECDEKDVVKWLNDKYHEKFLDKPITTLEEIPLDTASALISHLEMRPTRQEYLNNRKEPI